jgi:hypothetical protein
MSPGDDELRKFQQALLEQEQFVADVLRIRQGDKTSRWWESAPLMSAVIAVVSLVLGATATIYTQRAAKAHETQVALDQARRHERLQVLADLHKLIASVSRATQDRLDIATGILNDLTPEERNDIVTQSNGVDDTWREQRESNNFLIPYHFRDYADVPLKWAMARDSLRAYVECVESVFVAHFKRRNAPRESCGGHRVSSHKTVEEMWAAINRTAQ